MSTPVLHAAPAETFVSVGSNLLGPLRVSNDQVFGFAAGVCGFP